MPEQQFIHTRRLKAERRYQTVVNPVARNWLNIFQRIGWADKQASPTLIALAFINNDIVRLNSDRLQRTRLNAGLAGIFFDDAANAGSPCTGRRRDQI